MSGFDPSKFVEREAAVPSPAVDDVDLGFDDLDKEPGNGARPVGEAAVGCPAAASFPSDSWDEPAPTVATVATVAALPAEYPHADDLNRMFAQAPPPWLRASLWVRLLNDARKFVQSGKCADAIALGWEPIELFAFDAIPWRRAFHGRQQWGTSGLVGLLRGRGVGEIEAHRIEIINKIGAHERLNRATTVMNRRNAALMWDAFDPSNMPPPNAWLAGNGAIVDGARGMPP